MQIRASTGLIGERTSPKRRIIQGYAMLQIEDGLFTDIVIIFLAAFLGGLVARFLRLPMLLGYLAVGMVIGPHALRIVGEVDTVRVLAEFGVILLLFSVGIQISFRDLRNQGKVVILGGIGQIVATAVIAYLIGLALGWRGSGDSGADVSGAWRAALDLVVGPGV